MAVHACMHAHPHLVFYLVSASSLQKIAQYSGAHSHDQLTRGHSKHHIARLRPARATKTPDANTACSSYNKHGSWLVQEQPLEQGTQRVYCNHWLLDRCQRYHSFSRTVTLARDARWLKNIECQPYILVSCQGNVGKKNCPCYPKIELTCNDRERRAAKSYQVRLQS